MKIHIAFFGITFLLLATSCRQPDSYRLSVSQEYSVRKEDRSIDLFRLVNRNGMTIKVTNYAASLTDVFVPDRHGKFAHVVLGFDSVESYLGRHPKLGATVGRYANRIRNARFCLDGTTYQLEKNNKEHSIHGGSRGFNLQLFDTDTFYTQKDTAAVVFKYRSPHQEGGFPGNLDVSVAYKLTNRNEIIIEYTAVTDRPTVVNLTNHSYFNLSGCTTPVLQHTYMLWADSITRNDSIGIPTGELLPVAGTEYDFTSPLSTKVRVDSMGKGYDINYKLRKSSGTPSLELAAVVTDSVSGRALKAYTTEPGMQFYIPNSNMDYLTGHDGRRYGQYYGFCLEMQHFPDSPNHPQFPPTSLYPGETYRQTTVYKFETIGE
ncbi:aldose epimerase family protein [uncultured Bacteroides sp.]|uniref:aldose epimerase family protein n=1 Tax=uncultured Bacteroides sp. TaxID=162156 RepID=UPI00260F6658|nr:aldose epimerase family protein [uncultured Bacteroides sp.]